MEKQVNKNTYNFENYCYLERWHSYWHQLKEILERNPKNILEIGVGDKVIANYIRHNTNIDYQSADIAADLNPDIVCSVDSIKSEDGAYEMVCAFEVLEHLPFDKFDKSLRELRRVSKRYVIISLPHWGRHFSLDIKMPFIKRIKCQFKFNLLPIKHKFNGQHYWEIGKKGYSLKKIKKIIFNAGFDIKKDYIAFHSPYHHFFILEKK
ncbi:MAG: class I SAM-dependent methyltransferase [Patescibacteria group bacterium]